MSLATPAINWFAVLCIASLYLSLYLLGTRASRRATILDFTAMTLAGRRLPLGIGILTVTATWVGEDILTVRLRLFILEACGMPKRRGDTR